MQTLIPSCFSSTNKLTEKFDATIKIETMNIHATIIIIELEEIFESLIPVIGLCWSVTGGSLLSIKDSTYVKSIKS